VLLAASPLLDKVGGRYFEDCNEAAVVTRRPANYAGVAWYAVDAQGSPSCVMPTDSSRVGLSTVGQPSMYSTVCLPSLTTARCHQVSSGRPWPQLVVGQVMFSG
jgi:hypothetical protein